MVQRAGADQSYCAVSPSPTHQTQPVSETLEKTLEFPRELLHKPGHASCSSLHHELDPGTLVPVHQFPPLVVVAHVLVLLEQLKL